MARNGGGWHVPTMCGESETKDRLRGRVSESRNLGRRMSSDLGRMGVHPGNFVKSVKIKELEYT